MKIILNRKRCIGCGSCSQLCPRYFEQSSDGKATLKGVEVGEEEEIKSIDEIDCAEEATEICPVHAIEIEKN